MKQWVKQSFSIRLQMSVLMEYIFFMYHKFYFQILGDI